METSSHTRKKNEPPVSFSEIMKDVKNFALFQRSNMSCIDFIIPPRRRSLHPNVKPRLFVPAIKQHNNCSHTSNRQCRLLVTIVGAMNVPSRVSSNSVNSETTLRSGKTHNNRNGNANASGTNVEQPGDSTSPSNTFVQVIFQGHKLKTRKVVGSSPMWKQTLEFQINPPGNDFAPKSLRKLRESVEISLFDEFEMDLSRLGGYYEDENATITESRLLGDLSIPFYNICNEGSIKGIFRLNAPEICLGYREKNLLHEEGNILDNAHLLKIAENSAYIKVFTTLEPMIMPPIKESYVTISKEDEKLVKYANRWMNQLERLNNNIAAPLSPVMSQQRNYQILKPSIDGYGKLLTVFRLIY